MSKLFVTSRSGAIAEIPGQPGISLMELMRGGGVDEILAICGGSLSCATCHVYIAPEWLEGLPPISPDEEDLLDSCTHRRDNSRLSCQIPWQDGLDGMSVRVAEES